MRCTCCIMRPELRQSGRADPAYICPVCKQPYWARDGKVYHEKPEEDEKKTSASKVDKFIEVWRQWPFQKGRK